MGLLGAPFKAVVVMPLLPSLVTLLIKRASFPFMLRADSTKPFVGLRSNFDKVSLHPTSFSPNISTCFRAAISAENPSVRLYILALLRAGWLHGVLSSGPERKQSDWDPAPIRGLPVP